MAADRTSTAPDRDQAIEDYFSDQAILQQWLEDCTEDGGPYAFTPSSQLFASWKGWLRRAEPANRDGNTFRTRWSIED